MRTVLKNCVLVFCALAVSLNLPFPAHPALPVADTYWNDVARFLAGMKLDRESILYNKTSTPAYQNHKKFMNDLWARIQKETIDPVIRWRGENIPDICGNAPALYPLSGADIINLYLMFPDAPAYIMVALEKPGDVEALRDYKSRRLINALSPIRKSLYLYGMENYFQSKVMIQEMNNSYLPGTAPALLIFIARLGFFINKVENIFIDDSGAVVPYKQEERMMKPAKITGLRIYFTKTGDWKIRKLVYLSMKLPAGSIDLSAPEGRFLNRLRHVKTLLKSAVYLLHGAGYGPVRDFLLKRSVLIVQDDSGIPYDSFGSSWDIALYGVYKPYPYITGCRPVVQKDLARKYREGSLPLPFNFGYGILSGPRQSNLMVALKKF